MPYKNFVMKLFNERIAIKNTDSILGDLYKLIMNSSYGKTCQREILDETHITSNE